MHAMQQERLLDQTWMSEVPNEAQTSSNSQQRKSGGSFRSGFGHKRNAITLLMAMLVLNATADSNFSDTVIGDQENGTLVHESSTSWEKEGTV